MSLISTLYPGASDLFSVPPSPSTTPLSSAGGSPSTRNHVSHHRDLGDAVTAIQNNVTKITHNHDSTGLNGPKLSQANTHQSPDTDASPTALHHSIGTGANQAASGSHTHDTRYIRLDGAVDQVITGKKTFPSGTSGIAIPDFQNAQHNHLNTGNGGPSYGLAANTTWVRGDQGGNTTEDSFIHGNRFTLPANTALTGTIYIDYDLSYNTGAPGSGSGTTNTSDVFFYLSYNQGESPAFSNTKNLIQGGENFNGQMYQSNHKFANDGVSASKRMHLAIPIALAASSLARNNLIIVTRIVNNTPILLSGVNYYVLIQFTSPNFLTL